MATSGGITFCCGDRGCRRMLEEQGSVAYYYLLTTVGLQRWPTSALCCGGIGRVSKIDT